MPDQKFVQAVRVMNGLSAGLEKRILLWLAGRMPAAIGSDHLTALGFAAMIGAGLCYWLAGSHHLALVGVVVCLAVNWFGDSLDGTVARVRRQERPRYGFYVDHVLDMFGSLFLLGGLALSGFMTPFVALGLLVSYLMLTTEVYLATYSLASFRLSFFKIGPTELRILLAIGTLVLLVNPTVPVFGRRYLLFDVGGVVAMAGIGVALLAAAIAHTMELYRAEPLRKGVGSGFGSVIAPDPISIKTTPRRFAVFNVVGVVGFGVQILALWLLVRVGHLPYLVATVIAVETAILHNFICHWCWTWSDRVGGRAEFLVRLVRFNATNGAVSLVVNVALMALLQGVLGVHYLLANLVGVACSSVANFILGDRVVFASSLKHARDLVAVGRLERDPSP